MQKIDEKNAPRGQDWINAHRAAHALRQLLLRQGSDLTGLLPEPTAHALLGALRRHPKDLNVQCRACDALYRLCEKFAEICATLQRDPSVYATVRAAAKAGGPDLEKRDWYSKELCVWLQPPCLVWRGRVLEGRDKTVGRAHMVASQFYNSHFFH